MSTQRSFAVPKKTPTNVFSPSVLTYFDDEVDEYVPVPFTVKNGVLDIAIQDNVTANLLTANDNTYNSPTNQVEVQASVMGGVSMVTSLGSNMLIFLKNFINYNYNYNSVEDDYTEDITMHTAPVMTKLSFNDLSVYGSYTFSNQEPIASGFNLISRRPKSVAWIFKSPLVVKFKYDGDVKYLTLVSSTSTDWC